MTNLITCRETVTLPLQELIRNVQIGSDGGRAVTNAHRDQFRQRWRFEVTLRIKQARNTGSERGTISCNEKISIKLD